MLPLLTITAGLLATSTPALAGGCSTARAQSGRNPSFAQVSAAIDAASSRRQVPPALLKAIAWKESGWGQFWPDGRAKVSGDCGVGIMQITGGNWDYARLGRDYAYNIDAGAQALAAKMGQSSANVPASIGPDDRRVFENWYRGTYRYNGAGSRAEAYADAVFRYVTAPPESIRPYSPALAVNNPKHVLSGYRPTAGHSYVAHLDGRWASTLGSATGRVVRADLLPMFASVSAGRTLEGGQRVTMSYAVRNLGWAAWDPGQVSVMTWPAGRTSALADSGWRSATTPAAVPAVVPTGAVTRISFPVQAALVGSTQTLRETFTLAHAGRPIASATATSSWTLHPAGRPTASIVAAPAYTLEDGASTTATVQLAASDPSPGAGLDRVELSSRIACNSCTWSPPVRVEPTAPTAQLALRGAGGHEVRVRAVDRAGIFGEWSAAKLVVVPRDDSSSELAYDLGWETAPTAGAWLGSVHTNRRPGASVETTAEGTRFAVIGAIGPDIADIEVWLDGVLSAVVSPRADTTAQRQVIWETTTSPGRHHVRVRVAGNPLTGPSERYAAIDAIAAG